MSSASGTRSTTLDDYWHPVAAADELVAEEPRRFELNGEPLVAYRADDGRPLAFADLCIHRGTALSLGWITDGRLVCPYHGWEYGPDGRCVRIPALPEDAAIPAQARAEAFQATERYGLVWVAKRQPVVGIPDWPGGEWDDPGTRVFFSHRYTWNASAARTVENFMDLAHFPFLHEGMLGSRDSTVMGDYAVAPTNYGFYFDYEEEEPGQLHSAAGEKVHWEYFVWVPFGIHLKKTVPSGQETVISMFCSPTGPDRTELFLYLSRNYEIDDDDQPFIDFTHTIMEADRRIVESQRPVSLPVDLTEELHLRGPDAAALAYRRALAGIELGPGYDL